ncbi:hypothetical protein [Streptomyces sp. SAI-208]|uniref:hypothetical protein n=1 Tax=Streptomyces sp. SAI-208 TaxID=2940550 RepID=UPI002473AFBC|nr:hypothetical protein [Streptomyces sp. SAI-208]
MSDRTVTALHTGPSWILLAAAIDIRSHRVIGWSIADHIQLATDAIAAGTASAASWERAGSNCHNALTESFFQGLSIVSPAVLAEQRSQQAAHASHRPPPEIVFRQDLGDVGRDAEQLIPHKGQLPVA